MRANDKFRHQPTGRWYRPKILVGVSDSGEPECFSVRRTASVGRSAGQKRYPVGRSVPADFWLINRMK